MKNAKNLWSRMLSMALAICMLLSIAATPIGSLLVRAEDEASLLSTPVYYNSMDYRNSGNDTMEGFVSGTHNAYLPLGWTYYGQNMVGSSIETTNERTYFDASLSSDKNAISYGYYYDNTNLDKTCVLSYDVMLDNSKVEDGWTVYLPSFGASKSSHTVGLVVTGTADADSYTMTYASATKALTKGVWYHVDIALNDTTLKIYVDDSLFFEGSRSEASLPYIVMGLSGSSSTNTKYLGMNLDELAVYDYVAGTGFAAAAESYSVDVNGTVATAWTKTAADAYLPSVTYTSSDETVATVDANGVVTGLKDGEVTITAAPAASSGLSKATTKVVVGEGVPAYVPNADHQAILKEIALAFQRQGTQIEYDQSNYRRHIYVTPEDATAQKMLYLDCSSYVNAIYHLGFGVNILPYELSEKLPNTANYTTYAKENPGNVDVVGYWENADYTTAEEQTALLTEVRASLQVGDILVYRHQKESGSVAGHVYIYMGSGVFRHCYGSNSYQVNSSDPSQSYEPADSGDGQIGWISADNIFTSTSHSRYLFKATTADTVINFSLLRPLARGLTPTEQGLARLAVAGLISEKVSSVGVNSAVFTGDTITYTVTMENRNGDSALSDIVLADTLPTGTAFVEGSEGVTCVDGSISWTGDIAASATVTVSYTVKVTAAAGSVITSDATTAGGLKLSKIVHTVSGFSTGHDERFSQTASRYVGQSFGSTLELAAALYQNALGVELTGYTSVDAILDEIIDEENLTCYTDTTFGKILVPSLFGGTSIQAGQAKIPDNDRTRLVSTSELAVGDIILADYASGEISFVYAGNSKLLAVTDGVCEEITLGTDTYGKENDNVLITLFGYERFAVIRPSMASAAPTVDPIEKFDILGARANLGEDLAMKFFIDPDDLTEGETYTAKMVRTYADGSTDTQTETVSKLYSDGNYYVTYSGLAAKEMGDEIQVTVYDSEGYAVSETWTDSIKDYVGRAMTKYSSDAATVAMLEDMLNYGAAAQTAFGYDAEDLVNADLNKTVTEVTGTSVSGDNDTEYWTGAVLSLEGSIVFKAFFDAEKVTADMKAEVSFTNYNGDAVSYTVAGTDFKTHSQYAGKLYVPVTGLVIADTDTVITIAIKTADGTEVVTVKDSIASYVNRYNALASADANYVALNKAIMALGATAETYLLGQ